MILPTADFSRIARAAEVLLCEIEFAVKVDNNDKPLPTLS